MYGQTYYGGPIDRERFEEFRRSQVRSILTVCLNPCLDISVAVKDLELGALNLYEMLRVDAGGKGINVARQLGRQGWDNSLFTALPKTSRGIQTYFETEEYGAMEFQVPGELRVNLKVNEMLEGGYAKMTEFNGPGDPVDHQTAENLCSMLRTAAASTNVVALVGSLLPGLPDDIFAQVADVVRSCGGLSVLDASGEPMRAAMSGYVDIFKPNRQEIRELTGWPCRTIEEVARAASAYCRAGSCSLILVSLGLDGAVLTDGHRAWHAEVPNPDEPIVSLTGAGDSMTGVLVAFAARIPTRASIKDYIKKADLLSLLRLCMGTAQASVRLPGAETPTYDKMLEWTERIKARSIEVEGDLPQP